MKHKPAFSPLLAALLIVTAVAGIASKCKAAEFVPFVTYTHGSDLFTPSGRGEWTYDYVGAGVTIKIGQSKLWQFDLSHGVKSYDCNYRQTSVTASACGWESGTQFSARRTFRSFGK